MKERNVLLVLPIYLREMICKVNCFLGFLWLFYQSRRYHGEPDRLTVWEGRLPSKMIGYFRLFREAGGWLAKTCNIHKLMMTADSHILGLTAHIQNVGPAR